MNARSMLLAWVGVGATAGAGCVKGSPLDGEQAAMYEGGSASPVGCGYQTVTGIGAEAPTLSTNEVGPDPSIRHVHLGFLGDPKTNMVVTWRTRDDTTVAGSVRYGLHGGALDQEITGYTFRYQTGLGGVGDIVVRIHEAHLCGLTPDTMYDYQVVSDAGHTSPVYTFHTAPDMTATPDAQVAITSVGDSRDGFDVWADLVGQIQQRAPDLVLFSGDACTFGTLQNEWEDFFDVAEPLFATTPVISTHGNHDLNSINYYAQFAMPGDEANFGFDYGPAHITVANDSPVLLEDITGSVEQFLDRDLTAHEGAPWLLVTHHRPAYSASLNHGSDPTLQTEWVPIFDRHHVDLVLNGHDHDYERTFPMRGNQVQASPADGTVYVVSGGAGATLYDPGEQFFTQKSAKLHSAVNLKLRRGHLEMEAFDEMGAPVDSLVIDKP
ncbi:MAG TPA: metallophosphoesterase family protein [Kofleriaceae bacterium]|nr:metallophosphoesterase family protein [Kofleriaceae bacterium]